VLENEVKRRNTTLCYVVGASDQVRLTMIFTFTSERTSTELVFVAGGSIYNLHDYAACCTDHQAGCSSKQ